MLDSIKAARVGIARTIIREGEDALDEAQRRLVETARELTVRDQVMIAFAHKMLRTFEALVDDAERVRAEAMHHLKTLCECYIYLFEALKDEESAALVLGESLSARVELWRMSPSLDVLGDVDELEREAKRLCGGRKLPRLRKLAERHSIELGQWYRLVYRHACEPAHVGDLDVFLPGHGVGIRGLAPNRIYEALVALHYGTQIALATADVINRNEIGVQLDVTSARVALAQSTRDLCLPDTVNPRGPKGK